MGAKFRKGETEIRVQYIAGRRQPALLVKHGMTTDVLAFFKGEDEAKQFSKTLAKFLRGEEA